MPLLLFDYDGVLADTMDDLLRFGQQACDQLGVKHQVVKADLTRLEVMSFATYGRACQVPEPQVDAFVSLCLGLFAEKKTPPAIFPGLAQVLHHLATRHRLAIVTTNATPIVQAFITSHGLDGLFAAIYGIDSPGTKAEKIALARQQFSPGTPQQPVFMVGDSLSDVLAAHQAGVTSVAVTWGHQGLDILLRGKPHYVISSPQDLVEVIEL